MSLLIMTQGKLRTFKTLFELLPNCLSGEMSRMKGHLDESQIYEDLQNLIVDCGMEVEKNLPTIPTLIQVVEYIKLHNYAPYIAYAGCNYRHTFLNIVRLVIESPKYSPIFLDQFIACVQLNQNRSSPDCLLSLVNAMYDTRVEIPKKLGRSTAFNFLKEVHANKVTAYEFI